MTWLIVGGGVHGVHVAARLIGEARVDPAAVRIVDPAPDLLAAWRKRSRAIGMEFLRSPSLHNVDVDPYSLYKFRPAPDVPRPTRAVRRPHKRPARWLFDAHCDAVIDRFGLGDRHVRDHVDSIDVADESVITRLRSGAQLEAERAVLAVGGADVRWPAAMPRDDARVRPRVRPGPGGASLGTPSRSRRRGRARGGPHVPHPPRPRTRGRPPVEARAPRAMVRHGPRMDPVSGRCLDSGVFETWPSVGGSSTMRAARPRCPVTSYALYGKKSGAGRSIIDWDRSIM